MLYGVSETVEFFVIDTATGKGKISDNANLTLRWVKDGTSAALSGSPASSEIDSTNCPGLYKVTIAASDTQALTGTLHGKSTTTGVEVVPRYFEIIPAAGSANAVLGTLVAAGLDLCTITEPLGVPAFTTGNIRQFIAWLGAISMNKKTQTSTTKTLRNYADSATIASATVFDDGTTLFDNKFA